ncbi:calcium-binding protein [Methylopila sp. M107]|uniref:calcium-binding protein n=1 Tax=Methylopila sp. M107 TaxID=1101190 RepID=UPI0003649624|nr:calcium-binding protein [Methylopila sp. M107]
MAVGTITNFAVNGLEFLEFFDPDAALRRGTSSTISLVSRDGYELVLEGDGFTYGAGKVPTGGTITDIFLYDRHGDLVGRIDDVSHSLVDYYETVVEDGRSGAFTADLLSGDDTLTGNFARDRLQGYDGDDVISGGAGGDTLIGDDGDDTLSGGNGGDDLFGGDGDDVLGGGVGQDLLVGGAGNDSLSGDEAGDRLDGGSGNDTLSGGAGRDSLAGGSGDDLLDGGAADDDIEGQGGADVIFGGSGKDLLGGGSGADLIDGGADNDRLAGDGGADTLQGGDGFDSLLGGGGADTFAFVDQAHDGDLILDFKRGQDVLSFDAAGFDNLDADFELVTGKNPVADTDAGTFLYNTKTHELFWDANGDGAGQRTYVATLDGVKDLDKGDFLIV